MARDFKFGKVRAHATRREPYTNYVKVFKILWSEPRGVAGTQISETRSMSATQISQRVGKWGQMFTEKVRRFVIIDCRKGHCICL
jgi:hypothetical protein